MRDRHIHFRPRAAAGFTLLEVLVSFVLLGLLSSALYGALNLGIRTSAAVNRVTEKTQTITLAQNFLRGLMQRALGRTISEPGGRHAVSFAGGRNWVRFASTLPGTDGSQQDYLFELGLGGRGNQTDLYLAYAPVSSVTVRWQQLLEQRVVLARDVGDLRIEYLGADNRYGAQWLAEWSRHGSLPELVRINLEEATGSWPEFIVQPKVRPTPIDVDE
jgi:general secretion pathway protein J